MVANLLQLYLHGFSGMLDIPIGPDGRFGSRPLPSYWSDADHHPFLMDVEGAPAGFVFVRRGSVITGDEGVWDVAEFFVARGYRRKGLGTRAAHAVWERFPGTWEVRVVKQNPKAKAFWSRAIADFTGTAVEPFCAEKDGFAFDVFSFESKPGA